MVQYKNMVPLEMSKGTAAIINLGTTYQGDANANRVGVYVFEYEKSVTLSGQCAGICRRNDGNEVPLSGTVSGNMAYVTLDGNCYAAQGPITVLVKLVSGNDEITLAAAFGNVETSGGTALIQPVEHLPDYAQLLAEISNMRTATAAANTAATNANGATGYIAPTEASSTASAAHAAGTYFVYSGVLYRATADIASGGSIVTSGSGQNCEAVTVGGELVQTKDAVKNVDNLVKSSIEALVSAITITHQETVTANQSYFFYLDKPILRGTTFKITNDSTEGRFSVNAIRLDGTEENLSPGFQQGSTETFNVNYDIFGFRCYVNNTDWSFTLTYGPTVKDVSSFGIASPELNETYGYYYDVGNGAAITAESNFCYTAPIQLKKGETVVLTAAGYKTAVCMICVCDAANENRIPVVYSSDSSVHDYTYTASMDCRVTFSYIKTFPRTAKIYRKATPISIPGTVNENPASVGVVKQYVFTNGTRYDHPHYCITAPIQMKAGDRIDFTAYAETTVAALTECASDGTYIATLMTGKGTSNSAYSYVTQKDCYVQICFSIRYKERVYTAVLYEQEEINPVNLSFSMFETWGIVGDSFASGVFMDASSEQLDNHLQKSWPQILARKSGNSCVNFSMGGLYCGSWLTNSARGLPFLLEQPAKELYIIALGINDVGHLSIDQPLGTISDMNDDYTQNPATFYGNYGKIIGNIQTHAPKAKIILSTIPYNGTDAMTINNAIIAISEKYSFPCLMVHTDAFFRSDFYWANFQENHPKSFLYGGMANAYERMICESLAKDTTYWGNTFN